MQPAAVVVGAGIAGLASAISLANAGWSVTALERTDELSEVGAGFAMSANAVAAFKGLGFDDADVDSLGCELHATGTMDIHGRPIITLPNTPQAQETTRLIGVHRQRLHQALVQRARHLGVDIVCGARVESLYHGSPTGEKAQVNGYEADLVIGADGMHSNLRATLIPSADVTYSGYSSWRAITDRTSHSGEFLQYWGPQAEFGILPVSEDRTYWYGYIALPERSTLENELLYARQRFTGWADPVRDILARTGPQAVMRHDVYHLPHGIPHYAVGRVVMIGDAAHGFLPTMGQGAASALEDGLSVGLLIGESVRAGKDLTEALAAFEAQRRPRCQAIAQASLITARFGAHLPGGWRQTVRNKLMRLVPSQALTRASKTVMGWTPPH